MSTFIVSGGSLLEIGCPSSLDRSTEQQVSFTPIIGGKVKAFIRRGGRRSWSIDTAVAHPGEVSTIEAITRQMGPFGWYDAAATIGNLFSPQASSFEKTPTNATDAGIVQLPDGTLAHAVVHTGTGSVSPGTAHGNYEMVPVRAGQDVTVGAWASGGVWFGGFWRDAAQQPISNFSTQTWSFSGWQWREATITPPAGAAFLNLSLSSGTQYALPSVAWGPVGRPELGTGCPSAIFHSPSHAPLALTNRSNYSNSSYSVTEVG